VVTLRLVNRLLAGLLSLAMVAATVVLLVELVQWARGEPSLLVPWRDWGTSLADLRVDDGRLLAVAAAAAALGLLLLLFELVPRRPTSRPVEPLSPGVRTVATEPGLRSAAVSAARDVAGIRTASASVRRRNVKVQARTRARDRVPELTQEVRDSVEAAMASLRLEKPLRVGVDVEEER
jgi:hypothetical protein